MYKDALVGDGKMIRPAEIEPEIKECDTEDNDAYSIEPYGRYTDNEPKKYIDIDKTGAERKFILDLLPHSKHLVPCFMKCHMSFRLWTEQVITRICKEFTAEDEQKPVSFVTKLLQPICLSPTFGSGSIPRSLIFAKITKAITKNGISAAIAQR